LKNNRLLTKEAGKALAQALAGNSVLTELDVSCQAGYIGDDGPGFAQELAVGIKDNGALSKLIFGGDDSDEYDVSKGAYIRHKPAVLEVGITEADLSNRGLGVGGAIIVSTWISHKDNGALTKLDISNNSLEQGEALQQIIEYCNTKGIELDNHENESGGDY
jgi:hypothetical protein